jgi:poly-gamma-glutamate synthesis protein (capsule biosynthesis protein)
LGFRDNPEGTTFQLKISDSQEVSQWIYALVAPFPTVTDGVTSKEINAAWKGESPKDFKSAPLIMDESTLSVFSVLWGEPQAGSVKVIPADQILEAAWDSRPSWAIIPFESLVPYWKVLEIDGLSPIRKGFEPGDYELTVPISLVGDAPISPIIPPGNLDPDKLTTLAMTGVTALVRATAYTMERQGITYPARDIVDWLRNSDITHISNEVPFAKDCPFPNPVQQGMRFCSDTRYIELLEYVGTDIVELTGDHFSDWGSQAMVYTLELYDQRSWPYYGGGANLKDGRRALTLTHNGNRLAFIGCNAKGGGYARASPSDPGAVACDFSWMQSEITRLQEEGYLPIATFQHFEYYTYAAQPNQIRDARKLTESGAVIVSGSQAHHPQAFEFSKGGFVHHGLGNLFFDQLDVSTGTRQAFIDRHVFYNGRHISTELLTIWFVDYARPRSMTPVERETLLTAVFKASGW